MNHDMALLSLRPDLSHLLTETSSEAELFQNRTLRPILKMQHETVLKLTQHFPHFNSLLHHVKTKEDYKAAVIDFLKNQMALKNQIIGLIIGHFTSDEWTSYFLQQNEYNKRMIAMAGERIAGACWHDSK